MGLVGRHAQAIMSLAPEEVALVWRAVHARHRALGTCEVDELPPAVLLGAIETAGLCHAEVVISLARATGPVAESAIEKLVGRPLRRSAPAPLPALGAASKQSARRDPRVISWVRPDNPKKVGTKAHRVFSLYQVGMTVSDFVRAGGTSSSVRYDLEHGNIRIGT
jgi:hypothetical protein